MSNGHITVSVIPTPSAGSVALPLEPSHESVRGLVRPPRFQCRRESRPSHPRHQTLGGFSLFTLVLLRKKSSIGISSSIPRLSTLGWFCVAGLNCDKNGQFLIPKMNESNGDPISFARNMVALRKPLRLKGRWSPPRDGLYRVANSKKVLGGFLVQRRRVTRASPNVRARIHVLAMRNAKWHCDPFAG